jgi:hypothetical protein
MNKLSADLKSKCGLADETVSAYLKALVELNNNTPLLNLGFLKSTDAMAKLLEPHPEETKKAILTAITTVLSLTKDAPNFKRVYTHYYRLLNPRKVEKPSLTWDDILKKRASLVLDPYLALKSLSEEQKLGLLNLLVVSLYTDIEPRRNQDYLCMKVVKEYIKDKHTEDNYLCLSSSKMIFNKFKARKAFGLQTVDVPPVLMTVLNAWLNHHTDWKKNKKSNTPTLLFNFQSPNSITRILNKVLGKKVGSAYLKSIYPKETVTG